MGLCMNDFFENLLQQVKYKIIKIYLAKEIINDPYDNATDIIYDNPIPIKAIVTTIEADTIKWKYNGIIPYGSKSVICEKKYKSLILNAVKIEIDGEDYQVYLDSGKRIFEFIERDDYITFITSKKHV